MLIPLVTRHAALALREEERYGAWWRALRRLREDWEAGRRVEPNALAGEYLADLPDDQRPEALLDLVAEHLNLSWRSGPGPRLEAYGLAELTPELVEAEFVARHWPPHGDFPTLEDLSGLAKRVILGRYVLLRRLGLGAVGEVWESCDRTTRRLVAVKLPRAEWRGDRGILDRFERETLAARALDHPAIAGVLDAGRTEEGVPFAVMTLATGRPLGERIRDYHRSGRKLDELRRLLESFARVCDAVTAAHSQGVLHGDLKPGNVMVGENGETAVIDWGPRSAAGTPEYMAPEQADGRADSRSDIFGLGSILYEILEGRPPRNNRSADWRVEVRSAPVPAPRRGPKPLRLVCARALAADPAARMPDALALAAEVRRFLGRPRGGVVARLLRAIGRACLRSGTGL